MPTIRYQYREHLGSSTVEANENGQVISYEEYYPYGRSAYRAAASGVDLSLKRYRFTGKERDEETGLDYFGVRYYASWLGRWTSSDPGGFVDGLNLYRYVRNNPVNGVDQEGYNTEPVEPPPVDPPKKKKGEGYTHYGFLLPEEKGNTSPQIYESTYEVHSAIFSKKLVDNFLSGELVTTEALKKEVKRIQTKNYKDADSERYATLHYNAPGQIDIVGDSQVVSQLNSNNKEFTIYGYYNASSHGSLWRYKIVGGNEEREAPTMFYAWEVDEDTKQPIEYDAEYYENLRKNLPSPYTDLNWEEGQTVMLKTTLTVTAVLSLGATVEAGAGIWWVRNAGAGVFFSLESLSGGSGEGILEQQMGTKTKIVYNLAKTGSAVAGGIKAGISAKNGTYILTSGQEAQMDALMRGLNIFNTLKTPVQTGQNGMKIIEEATKKHEK